MGGTNNSSASSTTSTPGRVENSHGDDLRLLWPKGLACWTTAVRLGSCMGAIMGETFAEVAAESRMMEPVGVIDWGIVVA